MLLHNKVDVWYEGDLEGFSDNDETQSLGRA